MLCEPPDTCPFVQAGEARTSGGGRGAVAVNWLSPTYSMCAQHEHVHTFSETLKKCLKYKFSVLKDQVMHVIFPEGLPS